MLDHISLRVQDYDRALSFYKAALAPLGYELIMEFPGFAGLGERGKPDLWITASDRPLNPTHVAFRCDRGRVDAFHAAAVAAGATDDGAPGPRPTYHPNYYGAFVRDPEGNSIEAVCHDGPSTMEKIKAAGSKAVAAIKSAAGGRKKKAAAAGAKGTKGTKTAGAKKGKAAGAGAKGTKSAKGAARAKGTKSTKSARAAGAGAKGTKSAKAAGVKKK